MHVDPAQSPTKKPPIFDESEDFHIRCQWREGKRMQIRHNDGSILQIAAR